MSWTYTTLKSAVQDFLETTETTFVANLPVIVKNAEDRILKDVQVPDFRKNSTGTLTTSDEYLATPSDFLAPYSLAVDNTGYEFLLFKDVNFIREAYPASTTTGVPKYYALWDDDAFILAPTPDSNYTVELHYFHKPTSIVDGATSWLGDNAETALFDACILESYIFQKGDPDLMAKYQEQHDKSLAKLKVLCEGRNKMDEYRRP